MRETVKPTLIKVGQCARQQRPTRLGAHGRHVGKIHGQRLVAQRGRIDIGKKVATLDQHVDGKYQIAPWRRRDDRAVVTDPGPYGRVSCGAAKEAVDEREFVHSRGR